MAKDKVTVYIPTKNRLDLLKRAIESVVNQTYKNIEIFIIDDGSNDGTQEYIQKLINSSDINDSISFRYKRNNISKGACYCRNYAIINATGKYITGLDDDDFFNPNRIMDFITYWNENITCGNCMFLYTSYITKLPNNKKLKRKLRKSSVTFDDLICINDVGNQIFTETTLFRKNLFDPKMPMWQDLKCWLGFLKNRSYIAVGIDNHSYVIDKSHDYDRISKKPYSEIQTAINYISTDLNLSNNEITLLKNHSLNYFPEKLSLKLLINTLLIPNTTLYYKMRISNSYFRKLRKLGK